MTKISHHATKETNLVYQEGQVKKEISKLDAKIKTLQETLKNKDTKFFKKLGIKREIKDLTRKKIAAQSHLEDISGFVKLLNKETVKELKQEAEGYKKTKKTASSS